MLEVAMSGTVAANRAKFKHLFERVVDFVAAACYNSYMRSIEHSFDGRSFASRRDRRMSSPTSPAPVRLTRRGRVVITLTLMVGLMFAGFTLGRGSSQAAGRHHEAHHTVTVQAGDTLWSVAARVAPHADPRAIVDEISSLNRLTSPIVRPGEQLVVPTLK
jgi:hypothetical protein